MTTIEEAREAIYSRFSTQWGTTTPFTFENEVFNGDAQTVPWTRLSVLNTSAGQETLGPAGGRRFKRSGSVFQQVFTKAEDKSSGGLKAGDDLAKTGLDIFEATSFSGLDFHDGVIKESGPDGKWYMHLVETLFDYYETK